MSEEALSLNLAPINYYQVVADCRQLELEEKKTAPAFPWITEKHFDSYKLPATDTFTSDPLIGLVAVGWSEQGLECVVRFDQGSVNQYGFEAVKIEFFIDTRDLKNVGYNTRFCHHFVVSLNVDVPDLQPFATEVTRFRNTEESHPHCDPLELKTVKSTDKRATFINLWIPAHCLFGYDPKQLNRLGFTYRITVPGMDPQHFAVLSQEFHIDQQPSLWATLCLS